MFTTLSLVTSVKDYVEVVHKLIESDSVSNINTYYDLGALLSYINLIVKQFILSFFSFNWISNIRSLPIFIPDIASAMLSEISVLDGYFHNAFTFLEKPISYQDQNLLFYSVEKFTIGFINSLFLFLPTSTASLISLRRFVVQGIEAGYLSGLGTLFGSLAWIASILFGWRFLVIPWLSLDVLRYSLGLILLVKYMWDSYTERRMILEDLSKWKIFLLTFLLAFTEQTSLVPFLGNISIGSDATILESFPSNNFVSFFVIHGSYLLGLGVGGLSLLYFTCWFWENPAFQLYTWTLSAIKINARFNYKFLNFTFLYLTMICAMSNMIYFGLDSTLTKPFGFVANDRLIDQKTVLETSFLSTKASDRNTRMNMGRRGRRERWKKSVQRYRNFDASLYGEGIYDLFTIEDLNYGFDRFWLRRKMRNHDVPYRLFPGPAVRSFKKQLSRPRLESFSGPRLEFFRILFEQVYHPVFHEKEAKIANALTNSRMQSFSPKIVDKNNKKNFLSNPPYYIQNNSFSLGSLGILQTHMPPLDITSPQKLGLNHEFSTLRKFVRKVNKRIKTSKIAFDLVEQEKSSQTKLEKSFNPLKIGNFFNFAKSTNVNKLGDLEGLRGHTISKSNLNKISFSQAIYSKRWKEIFSKINHNFNTHSTKKQKVLKQQLLFKKHSNQKSLTGYLSKLGISDAVINKNPLPHSGKDLTKKTDFQNLLSKKDILILNYRAFLTQPDLLIQSNKTSFQKNVKTLKNNPIIFSEEEQPKKVLLSSTWARPSTSVSVGNPVLFHSDLIPFYKPLTLLHPIKFYLHKDKAFQRKCKFYGVNIFRNFGISNNSPYFRIMMKKFFYYYKPTLRWERTMRVATLKKLRRKGSRKPLRMNLSEGSPSTSKTVEGYVSLTQNMNNQKTLETLEGLQKPTHMYSLIGKRATRYRSQIYKDVLQHWYYSPFNRLLLKLDIDTFIRRQPVSHFLTKSEEHLLHFRRALLMDHYETLRWYTYMQHYRSMKTKIGGTKSFASRFYNQQFQGTFKKIRHLFSVTPSFTKNTSLASLYPYISPLGGKDKEKGKQPNILKWDQPLYNEYPNNQNLSILNDSLLHEELFVPLHPSHNLLSSEGPIQSSYTPLVRENVTNPSFVFESTSEFKNNANPFGGTGNEERERGNKDYVDEIPGKDLTQDFQEEKLNNVLPNFSSKKLPLKSSNSFNNDNILELGSQSLDAQPKDLINESKQVLASYLLKAGPIRQNLIAKYLEEKNYSELTRFLFKGQKSRGIIPTTQFSTFLNQEKEYLYTNVEKQELREKERFQLKQLINEEKIKQNLWMSLIKRSQTTIYDRKALKNYLRNKLDKQDKRKKIRQKQLKDRLERIQNWLVIKSTKKELKPQEVIEHKTQTNEKSGQVETNGIKRKQQYQNVSTGIQKAFKEAIQMQEGVIKSKRSLGFNLPLSEKSLFSGQVFSNQFLTKTKVQNQKEFQKTLLDKKLKRSLSNISFFIQKRSSHSKQSLLKLKRFSQKTFFLTKNSIVEKIHSLFTFLQNQNNSNNLETGNSTHNKKKSFFINIFKPKTEKSIQSWKRKQYVLNKRKQTRKVLKQLKKQASRIHFNLLKTNDLLESSISFLKPNVAFASLSSLPFEESFRAKKKELKVRDDNSLKADRQKQDFHEPWNTLNFTKDFQTRRARRRGARLSRNRGAIKKPTLSDKLKRQFLLLKRYGKKMDKLEKGHQTLNTNSENIFKKRLIKQRRTRERENRFWRRYKKPKYSQNRRKIKKLKRYSLTKIRNLNKELKRVESYFKIRKWWWENFLPDFRAHIDTVLQFSKDQQIEEKINSLSSAEIIQRNAKLYENLTEKIPGEHMLQIGNYDYKPLSLPQASLIRIQKELELKNEKNNFFPVVKNDQSIRENEKILLNQEGVKSLKEPESIQPHSGNRKDQTSLPQSMDSSEFSSTEILFSPNKNKNFKQFNENEKITNLINVLSKNLLNSEKFPIEKNENDIELNYSTVMHPTKLMVSVNPMPFYAGWDETLRKFLVTNRLLSRREAGYQMHTMKAIENSCTQIEDFCTRNEIQFNGFQKNAILNETNKSKDLKEQLYSPTIEFSQYPLKGMNVATTLYWQVPFTTYDPDQFFALGRDGFAPIGWNRFKFQYAKQTMKPIIVKTKILTNSSSLELNKTSKLFEKLQRRILNRSDKYYLKDKRENQIHFTQKRNKRIKRHPRSPASFPSGPLVSEVLPVHYIYVFYKRDRLPRDRYINRRLRRSKDGPSFAMQNSFVKLSDWTLRKRVKPRRKYHRKRKDIPTNIGLGLRNSPKTILRRKFRSQLVEQNLEERQRPLSKPKLGTGTQLEGRLKERYKQRKKNQNIKSKNENLRIRQLRRRVQRQVFRPVWRYKPYPGGWLWPGDYFRLELIKAPKLILGFEKKAKDKNSVSSNLDGKKEMNRKVQKKKKRNIQNWQIQQKKYFLQKHNIKVLKKLLQKSQQNYKKNQKVKELSHTYTPLGGTGVIGVKNHQK